jgi:3-oxoacyl-ACP reductase-like protein
LQSRSVHRSTADFYPLAITAAAAAAAATTAATAAATAATATAGFKYNDRMFVPFDIMMELSFILDVVLNFMTTYSDKHTKEECQDASKIRKRYLMTWFLPDCFR